MGKKVCLIDYENTALAGLDGLENLEAGDCVRIICSNESIGNTLLHILSVYRDRDISVEVEYMTQRGPNALDFRISCDLGFFIAQGDVEQIYVVSKDKGYLHAISEASALNSDVLIVCGVSIRDALFKVNHDMTQLPIEDFIKPCKEAAQTDADLHMEWQQTRTVKNTADKTAKALKIIKEKIPGTAKNKEQAKGNTKSRPVQPAVDLTGKLTNAQRKQMQKQVSSYIRQTTQIEVKYADHIAALVVKENAVMDFRKAAKKVLGKRYDKHEAEAVNVYLHFKK